MKKSLLILGIVVITLIPALLLGQPALPEAPSQAPIDGGLSLVALAGGAYATYKLKKAKK